VLNLSIGGPEDPILARLLTAAIEGGTTVVAARDRRPGSAATFPASLPGAIAVSPSDDGTIGRSDTGDLRAPGIDILTTVPQGSYDFLSGSSLAAAHVSGVVALLLERRPGLRPQEVLRILGDSASAVPGEVAGESTAGLGVDACRALASVLGETCADPRLAKRRPGG
jgi:subtilisin family serine protease